MGALRRLCEPRQQRLRVRIDDDDFAVGQTQKAGIGGAIRPIEAHDLASIEPIFRTNSYATFLCAAAAVRRLSPRHGGAGGVIVNISSAAGLMGLALTAGYGAVGFYLEHRFAYDSAPWAADEGCVTPDLVRRLQSDYQPRGLRLIPFINTLGPWRAFCVRKGGAIWPKARASAPSNSAPATPIACPSSAG